MKKKILVFVMSILMFFCFLPTNIFSLLKVQAETTSEEETVDLNTDLFDAEKGQFNKKAIEMMLGFTTLTDLDASIGENYIVDDFYNIATITKNYNDWLSQIGQPNLEFKFCYTIGGLKWVPTYISTDKNGNAVVTFWLNESKQDAWSGYENGYKVEENSTASFYNGSFYSTYSTGDNYMYSTSAVRSYALNNANDYIYSGVDENGEPIYTQYTPKENHPFALFTSPQSKLTDYIVTPSQMAWQEYQSPNMIINDMYLFETLNVLHSQVEMYASMFDEELIIEEFFELVSTYCQLLVQYAITPVNEGWTNDLINNENQTKVQKMVDLFFLYLDKQDEKYTKEYNTYSNDEQTAQNKITEYDNIIQTATQTILDCETAIAEAEERILNAATEEEKLQAEQDKQTAQETKQSAEQTKSEAETNKSTAQAELQTAQSNKQTAQYALNEVDGLRSEATGLFEMYLPYVSTDKYGNFYNFKNAGGLNYQDEPLYSNWKEDYLWLPSISETGLYSQNAKGI